MRGLFSTVFILSCSVLVAPACSSSDPPVVVSNLDSGTGGGGGLSDSSASGGSPADASADGIADSGDPDSPVAPVSLGMRASPPTSETGSSPAEDLLADLAVLSAGSRAGIVHARWDQLFDGASSPVPTRWAALSAKASVYGQAGATVVACLSVVDRAQAARPMGVDGAWNTSVNLKAGELLVDQAFSRFGDELGVLSLGVEVDRYLMKSSAAERKELVAFVRHVFDYARKHPGRPPNLQVGIGFNLAAVVAPAQPEVRELVDAGDVAVVSYVPLEPGFMVAAAPSPLADLDALADAVASETSPSPPIIFQEVALPSSPDVQSSEAKQASFLDSFFKALASRRHRHPIVIAAALHDGPQKECQQSAASAENPPSPAAIAAHCTRGVRSETGLVKPAQTRVFEALAAFSTP